MAEPSSDKIDWQAVVRERQLSAQVRTFHNNDAGYRGWLDSHPHGFVLNVDANPPRREAMLHTSQCDTIAWRPWLDAIGQPETPSYTTQPKICADTERTLIEWCRQTCEPSFCQMCR